MSSTPPPPAPPITQPIDLTSTETTDLISRLNAAGHKDAYGNNFTNAVLYAASTDEAQRKRILYLLALYALAIG